MSDFQFANPSWSGAMWLVAAGMALLVWFDWRRANVLSRFLSATMQARLVHRLSQTRRWSSIGCLGLAAASLVVALMRPQWGLTYHETPRVGAQIMVCLDVSRSMLAEDTAPNRLERAKAEVTDLLSYLEGDQIGLIAFAGRASVLCPLTPDFGFFRLILDSVGPTSVGRGGTRLEEPIRKALDSFRTEAEVSRMIVLITDGEDQDSHPLDAARAAAERGVKVLAIGFGDEAGSQIHVTDPRTGARTLVRDADGQPVVTRLDGETLRALALATEGAYIPAGTGALDLKSIYDAHIAPLVRGRLDARGHAVRREGFQWAVLAGLLFLVASVVVGSGSVKSELRAAPETRLSQQARLVGSLWVLIAFISAVPVSAQQQTGGDPAAATPADGVQQAKQPSPDKRQPGEALHADRESSPPRERYNEALAYLDKDADRAERLLLGVRRDAGADGEVRFRATYNMGWVEVKRADALLAGKPKEALDRLRGAADWFRDAVRLRPDREDARHNLEVVLRRILELADSLAKTDDRDLTERLDAVIGAQRRLTATARQVVERVTARPDPNAADQFRADFRQLAVQQQTILADVQAVTQSAQEELDALRGKKEAERTAQEQVRAAQLGSLLDYLNQAGQRLGHARSQMRRRQAERSFRRASLALSDLGRARDQLRGPVEVLDVILADALPLAQLTALKATVADAAEPALAQGGGVLREAPAWLSREFLEEEQQSLTERTTELTSQLQAGLDQRKSRPAGPPTAQQQQEDAQTDRFLAMVREAVPFLVKGKAAFEAAGQALATGEEPSPAGKADSLMEQTFQRQMEAISALRDARERFLDLRGLIELAYSREEQIQGLITAPDTKDGRDEKDAKKEAEHDRPEASRAERIQVSQPLQQENLERSDRIARLIDEGLASLPKPPPGTGDSAAKSEPADPAAEQAAAQRQQLELAKPLLATARQEMTAAAESLAKATAQSQTGKSPPDRDAKTTDAPEKPQDQPAEKSAEETDRSAFDTAGQHVARAVEHLQALRRLFFSIVEHLRETAQRQAQLNDETERVAASKKSGETAKAVGPLALRQQQLRAVTQQIADALGEQAKQSPVVPAGQQGADPKQVEQHQQVSQRLAQAAKLVGDGGAAMQKAGESLSADKTDVGAARTSQDEALAKLVEALALLNPPQPNRQNQQDQGQQGENQQGEEPKKEPPQGNQGVDPSRALQAVRDREAQRRRDRENQQRLTQDPVEKDW
ncbi:MAG: VWA domain-containing protein [Pirellulales bacterium]|nr:VWA domain-containing protein [Pirellulales bacterium]